MAFSLDREEAARRLGVSSRTIDRHIQAERIRTRRIGKKMFLEDEDVETLRLKDPARREEDYIIITDSTPMTDHTDTSEPEIVTPPKKEVSRPTSVDPAINMAAITELVRLYEDTRGIISQKDHTIQELSYKLGKIETELANSIPALEYKKATFMLESAKTQSSADTQVMSAKITTLESEVNKRNSALVALTILFVLVLAFAIIFVIFGNTIR